MYREYFGLKETPFSIAPDPHYFYISEGHREALAHLIYGIQRRWWIVLLTGEVGTGRTTVCRCLWNKCLKTAGYFYFESTLSSVGLLAAICDEFGIAAEGNETTKDLVADIYDFLLHIHETGRRAILIIEGTKPDHTSSRTDTLTANQTSQRKLLQIIMLDSLN